MTPRVKRIFPIALSVAALADALDVDRRVIDAMVKAEQLPVYQIGAKRRVLVEDAVNAIRHYWKQPRRTS
jgi:hypothetical protein